MQKIVNWAGNLGSMAAIVCAIHCLLMPLLLMVIPTLAGSFVESEPLEWAMWAITALFGGWSLWKSLEKHDNILPLSAFGIGILVLLADLLLHKVVPASEVILHFSGLVLVLAAQAMNLRLIYLAPCKAECNHAK